MGKLLYILVRCLCFLCVDHLDIVVFGNLCDMSRHAVGVKHHHETAPAYGLIVAEQIHEPSSGSVHVIPSQLPQLLPGKDDIVTVHQQIFLSGLLFLVGSGHRAAIGYGVPAFSAPAGISFAR